MGRYHIAALLVSLMMVIPCLALSSSDIEVPPGFTQARTGYCRVMVPKRNVRVVSELDEICTEGIREIFGQLGHKVGGEMPKVEVRIVSRPDEMADVAPKDSPPPKWSGAVAYPDHNMIIIPLRNRLGSPTTDLNRVMSHELSHLALRQALKGASVPRWFSEGIAIHQSESSAFKRHMLVWLAARRDGLISLTELEHYPESVGEIDLAYAQAADFLGFLIDKEGWLGVRAVIRRIGDGTPFEDAVSYIYNYTVRGLEREWRSGLSSHWQWIPLLTGTGALWGLIVALFFVAYLAVRKRRKERLTEMAVEEAALDNVIHAIDEMAKQKLPSRPQASARSAVPTSIRIDDEIHTLH